MPIVLVRHTSLAVERGICYGMTDLDVAESFAAEAQRVVAQIPDCDSLISSPLQRCTKLAHEIAARFGIQPEIDRRFAEMDFGSWEGMAWAGIPRNEMDAWARDFLHARPHGGETVAELRTRVLSGVEEYASRDGTQVIVCHAGVIKAAFATGDNASDFNAAPDYGEILRLD